MVISRGRRYSRRPKRGHRSGRLQHVGTREHVGLLLNALHRDGLKEWIAGVDAVVIEEGFRHGKVAWFHESIIGAEWGRLRGRVDSSQFVQHLLHLCRVDVGRVVGETVARLRDTMEHQQIDAVLPGVGTASDAVEHLVILQPQGGIPGLPVCPSVECGVGHVFV